MQTLKDLYAYREMIVSLVRKDLRGRYKASVLGFLWTFINPLLQLVVYTFVFSVILRNNIDKFYLYLFVALIPWLFFASSVTGGAGCIIGSQDLVKKIHFPRLVIPVAYVTSCFVNMLFCFVIIFIVVLFSGVPVNLAAWLFLVPVMAVEYMLCLGAALITSSLTVYLRDLEHILGIVTMAWQFLTPIMYPLDIVPVEYQALFQLNPMTPVITAYRDILYYGQFPQMETLLRAFILGIALLVIGGLLFSRLQRHFAEEL